jgi:hypothetical protein
MACSSEPRPVGTRMSKPSWSTHPLAAARVPAYAAPTVTCACRSRPQEAIERGDQTIREQRRFCDLFAEERGACTCAPSRIALLSSDVPNSGIMLFMRVLADEVDRGSQFTRSRLEVPRKVLCIGQGALAGVDSGYYRFRSARSALPAPLPPGRAACAPARHRCSAASRSSALISARST